MRCGLNINFQRFFKEERDHEEKYEQTRFHKNRKFGKRVGNSRGVSTSCNSNGSTAGSGSNPNPNPTCRKGRHDYLHRLGGNRGRCRGEGGH
jgi:hypothetical protein